MTPTSVFIMSCRRFRLTDVVGNLFYCFFRDTRFLADYIRGFIADKALYFFSQAGAGARSAVGEIKISKRTRDDCTADDSGDQHGIVFFGQWVFHGAVFNGYLVSAAVLPAGFWPAAVLQVYAPGFPAECRADWARQAELFPGWSLAAAIHRARRKRCYVYVSCRTACLLGLGS